MNFILADQQDNHGEDITLDEIECSNMLSNSEQGAVSLWYIHESYIMSHFID